MDHNTSTTKKHAKRCNGHRTLVTPTITDLRIALYCRVSTEDQYDRNTIRVVASSRAWGAPKLK